MFKGICATALGAMLLTSTAFAGDAWFGVYAGPRFNSATGDAVTQMTDAGGKKASHMGIAGGVLAQLPLSPQVHLLLGAGYTQRGLKLEAPELFGDVSVQAVSSTMTTVANYLDLNLGVAWHFLGSEGVLNAVSPYVGVDLLPGFFLSGTSTAEFGGSEMETKLTSDDIQSFHFAVRPNAGVDFPISDGVRIGANLGYELGLTNANKDESSSNTTESSIKWNGITTAIRLSFKL
ncbi:MAG: outer membrane beta-barrel protein [Bradyrhizobiaceae bacterium]|nr:outer membrane beta-barrel protein [Bradyrhizobiaceae bacterium]